MEAKGKRYIHYPSRSDRIRIWNLSDLHIGNRACAIEQIKRDVEEIRHDPYSFWIGGGDYADHIGHTDKRFDPDCIAENISVRDLGQLGRILTTTVRDLFVPIKDKCLGLLYGNHELRYERDKEQADLHAWLCTELGVENLGYSAIFDVVFQRGAVGIPSVCYKSLDEKKRNDSWAVRFFVHHGAGFACTPAGKLKRLMDFMAMCEADIVMVGHVHDQSGKRIVRLTGNSQCTKIISKESLGVISGSYLKTYAQGQITYGEQRGYAPTVLGSAIVTFVPDKREFRAEI